MLSQQVVRMRVKTGVMDLPLHLGHAPRWLFERMIKLSGAISEAIIDEYGTTELLRRLADPLWFQALGCVIGFDWHSSGLTTTTMGALKLALNPENYGVHICGGKGKVSRMTPQEIQKSPLDVDKEKLVHTSRLTAKVDNSCIQDGFALYHHTIIFDEHSWAVIQQGMSKTWARRYHWFNQDLIKEHPIASDKLVDSVLDLVAKESEETRKISLDLVNDNPIHLSGQLTLLDFSNSEGSIPRYLMPRDHEVKITPSIMEALQRAYEIQPSSYEELVAIRGIGPKSLRALALTAELVYGARPSWRDPAKYSFAHGGKDGTPFPVDRKVYDETIQFMKDAVDQAKLGNEDKKRALKRLAKLV